MFKRVTPEEHAAFERIRTAVAAAGGLRVDAGDGDVAALREKLEAALPAAQVEEAMTYALTEQSLAREAIAAEAKRQKDAARSMSEMIRAMARPTPEMELRSEIRSLRAEMAHALESRAAPTFESTSKGEAENLFRKSGKLWRVRYRGGPEKSYPNNRGMPYLAALLAASGKWLSVVELHFAVCGVRLPVSNVDFGIDEATVKEWKRRLREMSAEREQARAAGLDVADDLSPEGAWIAKQLAAVLGPYGKRRRESADVKAARQRVCVAITRAIASIAADQPDLGKHLKNDVHQGFWCIYSSDGVEWAL